jgi:hypothetical protein
MSNKKQNKKQTKKQKKISVEQELKNQINELQAKLWALEDKKEDVIKSVIKDNPEITKLVSTAVSSVKEHTKNITVTLSHPCNFSLKQLSKPLVEIDRYVDLNVFYKLEDEKSAQLKTELSKIKVSLASFCKENQLDFLEVENYFIAKMYELLD